MPNRLNPPIRMCIQCRERREQKSLIRLQCLQSQVVAFTGAGRSFYLCQACKVLPGTIKHLRSRCKVPKQQYEEFEQQLRETLTNG